MKYTEQQFNAYKERLGIALYENGLSSDEIYVDPTAKNFITNYVQENLIDKKQTYALQGIVHKLAQMDIGVANKEGKTTYPIINEYKGHDLQKTIYFRKDKNGSIEIETVPVLTSAIVLP